MSRAGVPFCWPRLLKLRQTRVEITLNWWGRRGLGLNPKGNVMRGLHWTCQTAYVSGAKILSSSSYSIRRLELPHCQLFCDSTRPTDMHIPSSIYWKWFHSSYFEIHPETCSMMWQCIWTDIKGGKSQRPSKRHSQTALPRISTSLKGHLHNEVQPRLELCSLFSAWILRGSCWLILLRPGNYQLRFPWASSGELHRRLGRGPVAHWHCLPPRCFPLCRQLPFSKRERKLSHSYKKQRWVCCLR